MEYDKDKVDDMVLALMSLVFHGDKTATRAWKSFDWDSLNRLYEKGFISNPVGKAKSVLMTPEGIERSEKLFKEYFSL
jgi:hypothetical protein